MAEARRLALLAQYWALIFRIGPGPRPRIDDDVRLERGEERFRCLLMLQSTVTRGER
jgi:hypothetical protein